MTCATVAVNGMLFPALLVFSLEMIETVEALLRFHFFLFLAGPANRQHQGDGAD